jgi:hypothetical protein
MFRDESVNRILHTGKRNARIRKLASQHSLQLSSQRQQFAASEALTASASRGTGCAESLMHVNFAQNFPIDIQARFTKLTNQSPPPEQDQID